MQFHVPDPITDHQRWVKTKTSQVLLDLSRLPGDGDIRLIQLLRYMRGRAFGVVMILLAILSLIPNLFGHAILTGLLLSILSVQMILGFNHIWLPRKVLNMGFERKKMDAVMQKVSPRIARFERLLKPRLICMTEQLGRRFIGLAMLFLSLLILVPFPFTNFGPAMTILMLSLGLIEKDGLVVILGLTMTILTIYIVIQLIRGFI